MNLFKNLPSLNIKRKPGRSLGIGALVFSLALSLFLAAFVAMAMKNGLDSTKARLGADIVVLPVDAQEDLEGALLSGKPNSFYLPKDVMDEVKSIEGVERVSPQVYIASLSASCCSFPIQIIGIDFDTDFSVKPWLKDTVDDLKDGEILVGANIFADPETDLMLFGENHRVKQRLDKTGMGFDNSVFMTIEGARQVAKSAGDKGVVYPDQEGELISNIMVDVEEGQREDFVAYEINKALESKARAIKSDTLMTSIAKQMSQSANYLLILLAVIWLLCIAVLLIVFPMITKTRAGELATLRILGARKKDISSILLKEMLILSFIGALIGAFLGLGLGNLFAAAIKKALDMPFLAPSSGSQVLIAGLALIICTLLGPISSLVTTRKLAREEIALAYSREA